MSLYVLFAGIFTVFYSSGTIYTESFLIINISNTYLKSSPMNIMMTIGNTMDITFFLAQENFTNAAFVKVKPLYHPK